MNQIPLATNIDFTVRVTIFILTNRLLIVPNAHNSYTGMTVAERPLSCYFYQNCIILQNDQ